MATVVWHRIEDKSAAILVLSDDAVYRFGFSGKNARQDATVVAAALLAGQDPESVVAGDSKVLPLGAIQRVEVSHDRETVKFVTADGDRPIKVEFAVQSGDDAPGIAREVVERAAIPHPERTEDIGVVEALVPPVIVGTLAAVVWGLLYSTASTLQAGGKIDVNKGGFRVRSVKRLFVFCAETLGMNGTIVVGSILLFLIVGWAFHLIVKRPQRLVWGPLTI
jgi:hypothetical protein